MSCPPVIVVSTKGAETDKVWGTRQGASGYLTKPVDGKVLVSVMDSVIQA